MFAISLYNFRHICFDLYHRFEEEEEEGRNTPNNRRRAGLNNLKDGGRKKEKLAGREIGFGANYEGLVEL